MITPFRFIKRGLWCGGFLILIFIAFIAEIYRQGDIADIRPADAIIVLGAGAWDGKPSPIFQARLDHASKLYTQGYASSIIITGGKPPDTATADSQVGKKYLLQSGMMDADHIFTEETSRTTLQNFMSAREIMRTHNFQSVLLTSHDFHMMRAEKMARDAGITVFTAPVKTKNQFTKFQYAARESLMYLFYILFQV